MKKIFLIIVLSLITFQYSYAAGSNDNGGGKQKTNYDKAVTLIKSAKKHVLIMVKNQALNCHSGKQIPCEIDSVCIHGDNQSSLATAKSIRNNLLENKLILKPLNKMEKFKNV